MWLRVALAAGAGLASLMVCSAVLVAILLLLSNAAEWWYFIYGSPSSGPSPIFWVGLVILLIVAAAGLSLPARALGAKWGHVTKTALLSVLGFCASMVFVVASPFILLGAPPLAWMAIVATPIIGSLFAIREDHRYAVGLVEGPTLIAAGAIYCASLLAALLAIWLSRVEEGWLFLPLVPLIVASSSWVVVPGIVATLRPD
jgi:hypothetical protein